LGGDALAPWRAQPSHERAPFDVILNNPPFHQKGARLSSISAQMFREARDALAPWGALWVVGNRQLGYHAALKRLFERAMVPSEHPKFVVVCAERPRLPSRA
jgi:16S rRNA (guanine1207-N2)-methyltransferase